MENDSFGVRENSFRLECACALWQGTGRQRGGLGPSIGFVLVLPRLQLPGGARCDG